MKRGEIYYANLSPAVGSEQGGKRPVVIIQNDIGNRFSPTVIVAAITTVHKSKMPTHVQVGNGYGLPKDSVILCEQIRTIDKQRLTDKVGQLDETMIAKLDHALQISIGLVDLGASRAS